MGGLQELFEVHKNLDTIALDTLEKLYTESGRLHANLGHLRLVLSKISELKKAGKQISPAVRESLKNTLTVIKNEILTELRLEERVSTIEGKQEKAGRRYASETVVECPNCHQTESFQPTERSGVKYWQCTVCFTNYIPRK